MLVNIASITALVVCLSAAPALAQLQGGNLNGTIKDEQGGVLPGATVTVVGNDRTLTFATESDGQYRFLALPPGTYTLTVALEGFAPITRENITVTVGGNPHAV